MNELPYTSGISRFSCSVLAEMRDVLSTLNEDTIDNTRSVLANLIEELQILASRMESGLESLGDIRRLDNYTEDAKSEILKVSPKGLDYLHIAKKDAKLEAKSLEERLDVARKELGDLDE